MPIPHLTTPANSRATTLSIARSFFVVFEGYVLIARISLRDLEVIGGAVKSGASRTSAAVWLSLRLATFLALRNTTCPAYVTEEINREPFSPRLFGKVADQTIAI